jgi:hypothetical protein
MPAAAMPAAAVPAAAVPASCNNRPATPLRSKPPHSQQQATAAAAAAMSPTAPATQPCTPLLP